MPLDRELEHDPTRNEKTFNFNIQIDLRRVEEAQSREGQNGHADFSDSDRSRASVAAATAGLLR
jgi:hypothetical protein